MRKSGIFLLSFAALMLVPAIAHAAGAEAETTDVLEHGFVIGLFVAFGWGFLTSLTPCVYPMIPIIIAVFGARDETVTRRKAMLLATTFVLGISTLYTGLGVAFSLAGSEANQLLSNPYVVVPIAVLLIVLAASMFGLFEIRLPYALQQKLNQVGGKGYGGAYSLGLVLGIVAAPCTGVFALSIIVVITKLGKVVQGATLMFSYSLGMGVLFWLLAVFALALPKSGTWMETIKSACGILLIGMAGYFLFPIVPSLASLARPSWTFLGGALFLAFLGFAIGAAHLSYHGGTGEKIRKTIGITLAAAGFLGAVGWWLTPDRIIDWRHDETAAFAEARESGKHVLIDFGADWCVPCKQMSKVIGDDELYDEIVASFVPLKFDVSERTDEDEALQDKYGAGTLPAVIFLDVDGNELARYTTETPSASSFRATMRGVIEKHPL